MFDLEGAINNWRKQMLAEGIKAPVPLDELESHLREDIHQRLSKGASESKSFWSSVEQLGYADVLRMEFEKNQRKWFLPSFYMKTRGLEKYHPKDRYSVYLAMHESLRKTDSDYRKKYSSYSWTMAILASLPIIPVFSSLGGINMVVVLVLGMLQMQYMNQQIGLKLCAREET